MAADDTNPAKPSLPVDDVTTPTFFHGAPDRSPTGSGVVNHLGSSTNRGDRLVGAATRRSPTTRL
jgi:hypothetical protein